MATQDNQGTTFGDSGTAQTIANATIPDLGGVAKSKINYSAVAFVAVCALIVFGGLWYFFKSDKKASDVKAQPTQTVGVPPPPLREANSSPQAPGGAKSGNLSSEPNGKRAEAEAIDPNAIGLRGKRMGIVTSADGKETRIDDKSASVINTGSATQAPMVAKAGSENLPEGDPRKLLVARHGSVADTASVGVDGLGLTQDLVRRRAVSSGEVSIMVGGRFVSAGETASVQHVSAEREASAATTLERRATSSYTNLIPPASSRSSSAPLGKDSQSGVPATNTTAPTSGAAGRSQSSTGVPGDASASAFPPGLFNSAFGASSSTGTVPTANRQAAGVFTNTSDLSRETNFPVVKARQISIAPDRFVVQGTIIQCVMQNQIVSTLEAPTLCNVTNDIRSSNGAAVLIPAGSRVIGEYKRRDAADDRIAITWNRLITPDNIDVAISSIGTDAMGGGGVPAQVDNMYPKRFGSILFYSLFSDLFKTAVYQYGPTITRSSTDQASGRVTTTNEPFDSVTVKNAEKIVNNQVDKALALAPRLTVLQGSLVSIITAQDLDFSGLQSRVAKR